MQFRLSVIDEVKLFDDHMMRLHNPCQILEIVRMDGDSGCIPVHGCCRSWIRVQQKGLRDEDGSSLLEGAIPVCVADSSG